MAPIENAQIVTQNARVPEERLRPKGHPSKSKRIRKLIPGASRVKEFGKEKVRFVLLEKVGSSIMKMVKEGVVSGITSIEKYREHRRALRFFKKRKPNQFVKIHENRRRLRRVVRHIAGCSVKSRRLATFRFL
jgi:hypothetical protein